MADLDGGWQEIERRATSAQWRARQACISSRPRNARRLMSLPAPSRRISKPHFISGHVEIDSRTVLGEQGGEQLLGQGDMLYMGGAVVLNASTDRLSPMAKLKKSCGF